MEEEELPRELDDSQAQVVELLMPVVQELAVALCSLFPPDAVLQVEKHLRGAALARELESPTLARLVASVASCLEVSSGGRGPFQTLN